jgi:opacity protein-like surface antigen
MRKFIVVSIFFISSLVNAQDIQLKNNQGGLLSLGVRSTISAFNDSKTNNFGKGIGGQFRLQLSERVNTDWFFDYLTSDIGSVAHRTDYHIGWSVLFYPYLKENQLIKPYIVAGHCFDYSYMAENSDKNNSAKRWSSAVQAGIGTHINLSKRMDLSLTSQYMIHLGNHIDPVISSSSIVFQNEGGISLEGHLLLTVGLNYKLIDLW